MRDSKCRAGALAMLGLRYSSDLLFAMLQQYQSRRCPLHLDANLTCRL